MLDYKIKELKKQIEPRENELRRMKQQILEVQTHVMLHFYHVVLLCLTVTFIHVTQ